MITCLKVKYKNRGVSFGVSKINNSRYYQIQIKLRFGFSELVIFFWRK